MRFITPLLLGACLLAGPAAAAEGVRLASSARAAPAEPTEPGGPLRSTARARFCAQTYPADFYDGWVKNGCTRAPSGPKFEYLTPAWRCLCLGHG